VGCPIPIRSDRQDVCATGWLMLHIYGLLAEFEARRDSARNKAMHERRRGRVKK